MSREQLLKSACLYAAKSKSQGADLIVEMVGAGGTGKTSIAKAIASQTESAYIGTVSHTSYRSYLRATSRMLKARRQHNLNLSESLSFFRKCSSVETGLFVLESNFYSKAFMDEGPIRTLRDTRCSSFNERAAWWSYAKDVIVEILDRHFRIVVVMIRLDDKIRRQRYSSRISMEERVSRRKHPVKMAIRHFANSMARRSNSIKIPTISRAVDSYIRTQGAESIEQLELRVLVDESPDCSALRLMEILNINLDDSRLDAWQGYEE
jgi:dephospho-CoA kinase